MRGLGNTDFDLAASQPVSIVMDNVVMENVVLKSFPLFGRNTTAASVQDYASLNVGDGKLSYEVSANYKVDNSTSVFARYANGFRAQTIQARDVTFEGAPSVADAETIFNFTARYTIPAGDDGEFYVFTDWAFQGKTNIFL